MINDINVTIIFFQFNKQADLKWLRRFNYAPLSTKCLNFKYQHQNLFYLKFHIFMEFLI